MPRSKPVPPSMVGWMRRENTEFAPHSSPRSLGVFGHIFRAGLYRVCVTHVKVGALRVGFSYCFPDFLVFGHGQGSRKRFCHSSSTYISDVSRTERATAWRLPENRTIVLRTFVVPTNLTATALTAALIHLGKSGNVSWCC